MNNIVARELCSGCTACASVCPKQCIQMKPNKEGFLYPEIDAAICVECGACKRTCPVLNKPKFTGVQTTAFAAYAEDETVRLASSSGGIFSLLAEEVLEHNGVVYGAAFDEKFHVHHIGVETKDELGKLRGSKYVQSNLGHVFADVKEKLENGKVVLFSGVICQIAGLKAYLKKDYPNLLTIDVLCHGVPSPKLWQKYLDELEKSHGSAVRRMFFRHKKYGWKTYSVSFEFSNDTEYEEFFSKDPYMQIFLRNISLRPSCYNCHFNELDRVSDITLGDCWGINRIMPEMDDDKGTSVILIHSEKGKRQFEKVSVNMVTKQANPDTILPPTAGGRKSVKPHHNREKFFKKLNEGATIKQLLQLSQLPLKVRAISFVKALLRKPYRAVKELFKK